MTSSFPLTLWPSSLRGNRRIAQGRRHRSAIAIFGDVVDFVNHASLRICRRARGAPCKKYRAAVALARPTRRCSIERIPILVLSAYSDASSALSRVASRRAPRASRPDAAPASPQYVRRSVSPERRPSADCRGRAAPYLAPAPERRRSGARAIGDLRVDEIEQHVEIVLGRVLVRELAREAAGVDAALDAAAELVKNPAGAAVEVLVE